MGYRKNAKPDDVEEVPVRGPIRWHRASAPVVVLLWGARAVASDLGAFDHMPMTGFWSFCVLFVATVGSAFWNMHRAIDRRDW